MQTDARTTGFVAELRALLAKATPGPWRYRPEEYDDWGFIRGGERGEFGFPMVAVGRGSHNDHDEHRRNGTDPYGPNSELIVAAANALPTLLDALETQGAHEGVIEALLEAFAPFVDIGAQKGAWGAISKKLDGMAPLTVTVTKAQMLAAITAIRALSSGKTVSAGEGS